MASRNRKSVQRKKINHIFQHCIPTNFQILLIRCKVQKDLADMCNVFTIINLLLKTY